MKGLLVVALVLAVAGNARAESAPRGPWFVGANVHYIRDGRTGLIASWDYEGTTGFGYGLEAGRTVVPWLSVALTYRLASVSGDVSTDPGQTELTERQHRIGPRIDLWPIAGRLRFGVGLVRTWRRTQLASRTVHYADTTYELSLGVVPVRWRNFELEVTGTFSRDPTEEAAIGGENLSTFTVGLGLRWRD